MTPGVSGLCDYPGTEYVTGALERKVEYMGYHGRNFDNTEMCTL
jgi:hypothetical protein